MLFLQNHRLAMAGAANSGNAIGDSNVFPAYDHSAIAKMA